MRMVALTDSHPDNQVKIPPNMNNNASIGHPKVCLGRLALPSPLPRGWRSIVTLLASVLFTSIQVMGQTVNSDEDNSEDAITVLSPFLVSAESETGWVATESLAGSRLRTDLKDLAAPIEVLTKDFMDEFGLSSYAEATIYTTSVEGFGDNLETGPGLALGTGFPPQARIRGLGNATLSRDFFAARMPLDNYNIDRVTIASGPNNLLFGLGNPAGVIDSSLKRAMFRDSASIDMQFDSHASQRYSLDVNKEIVDGKLALRLSAVTEDENFEYQPSHYDHDRIYGALEFRPWTNTSISLSFEDIRVANMRPSLLLPFDQITSWFTAGSIPSWSYKGVTVDTPAYDNVPIQPDQPGFGFGPISALNNTPFFRSGGWAVLMVGPNAGGLGGQVYNLRNTVIPQPAQFIPSVDGLSREADGFTLLDDTYYSDRINLGGLSREERIDSQFANLSVTQQIGDNLFLEFAAQQEDYHGRNAGMFGYVDGFTLKVDPNKYAADGATPNPNFGKLYVEGNPYQTKTLYESEDWRFTGTYELDFTDDGNSWWRKVLGKQRIAGLLAHNEEQERVAEYFARILPAGGLNGVDPEFSGAALPSALLPNGDVRSNFVNQQSRVLWYRYYLDGDVPMPSQDMFAPITFTDSTGSQFSIDMENTGITDEFGRRLGAGRVSGFERWVDTQQLAYQGFFWDDRLAVTLGWRKDKTNSGDIANGGNVAHVSGLFPVAEDLEFQFNPANEQTGSTRTRGFVLRPFKGFFELPLSADISFIWNRSNTFQPNAATVDPFGNRYPGANGAGEDKGIRLSLLDERISFRYTEYENTAGPSRAANVPFNRFRFGLAAPINRVKKLAGLTEPLTLYNNNLGFNAGGDGLPYSVMSNQRATGKEFGLDWNVNENIQIRFNMNQQEVVESDIAKDWFEWMELEMPKYAALTYPEGGVDNPQDLNGNGVIDTWTWDTAWVSDNNPQTIADLWDNNVIAQGRELIESLDGKSNEFIRDDRYNIMAVYRFTEGRLKGLSIGGAFRYRAAPLIGYGSEIFEGAPRIDIDQPYYGKAEKIYDLSINYKSNSEIWKFTGYHVGLNIRNLFDADDNYVRLRGVDGSPTRIARVAEGRTFLLNLGLEF